MVGPQGREDRGAIRRGHEAGSVTLGGRRVAVPRLRVRAADGGGEVAMASHAHVADRDPSTKLVVEPILAGVSPRRLPRTREPVRPGGRGPGALKLEVDASAASPSAARERTCGR